MMKFPKEAGFFLFITTALVLQVSSSAWVFGQNQETRSESQPSETERPSAVEKTGTHLSKAGDADDYVIGPEDVLGIDVFNVPELSQTVRVADDGTIPLLLVGRVEASGLTADELRRILEEKYGKTYLQNPELTVFVKEFHAEPVSVIGAVEKPGLYPLTGPRTLIEMLSMAGGLAKRDSAPAGHTVFVTRKDGFGDLNLVPGMQLVASDKLEIDLRRLLYSQQDTLNIRIHPRDIISVPKADIIYVAGGGVVRPGGFVLEDRDNVTVLQALAMAQGLAPNAAKTHARIIRTLSSTKRLEIAVDLKKVIEDKASDPELMANDILYVPDSTQKAALKRSAEAIIGTLSGLLIYGRL